MIHIKLFIALVIEVWKETFPKVRDWTLLKKNKLQEFYFQNKSTILKVIVVTNILLLVVNMGVCAKQRILISNTNPVIYSESLKTAKVSADDIFNAFMFRVVMYDENVTWKVQKVSPEEFPLLFREILPEMRVFSKIAAHTDIFGRIHCYTIAIPEFNDGYGFLPNSIKNIVEDYSKKMQAEGPRNRKK